MAHIHGNGRTQDDLNEVLVNAVRNIDGLDKIKALVDAGADINAKQGNGGNAFHVALNVAQHVGGLSMGRRPSNLSVNERWHWDLSEASLEKQQRGVIDVVSFMLNNGADLSIPNSDGKNPSDFMNESGGNLKRLIEEYKEKHPDPNIVIMAKTVGALFIKDAYSFEGREMMRFVSEGPGKPVTATLRQSFKDVADKGRLEKALAIHQKRGGTVTLETLYTPERKIKPLPKATA